jgi:hypothetical protein
MMRTPALLTTAVLGVSLLAATPAHAATGSTEAQPAAGYAALDEAALAASLAHDDIELQDIVVGAAELRVTTTSELGDGSDVSATMTVDVDTGAVRIRFDSQSATLDGSTYEIDVDELNGRSTELTVTDTATGAEASVTHDEGEFAALPLVLGIPLAISVLEALLAATAVVVVAGITYVAAAEAIKAIRRGSSYNHFRALRRSNGLFIGNGMTFNSAIQWARLGRDTWSTSFAGARAVARGVKNANPVGPEIDEGGKNKFWHFHPSKRRPAMHAFYGTAR